MQRRYVYLAGPVLGQTEIQAKSWRNLVAGLLEGHGIIGISPLRCEPPHGERYTSENPDPLFGTPSGIMAKNLYDIKQCDATLAYFPPDCRIPSLGTCWEMGAARALDKPVILVAAPPISTHPVLAGSAGWVVPLLVDAVDILGGVLGGYCSGGKNV